MQWNEPYVHVVPIHITSVQRVITCPKRYFPGSGDLVVYYNGLYAVKDKDYIELTPFSIEFLYDLEVDDKVVLHYQKLW